MDSLTQYMAALEQAATFNREGKIADTVASLGVALSWFVLLLSVVR